MDKYSMMVAAVPSALMGAKDAEIMVTMARNAQNGMGGKGFIGTMKLACMEFFQNSGMDEAKAKKATKAVCNAVHAAYASGDNSRREAHAALDYSLDNGHAWDGFTKHGGMKLKRLAKSVSADVDAIRVARVAEREKFMRDYSGKTITIDGDGNVTEVETQRAAELPAPE